MTATRGSPRNSEAPMDDDPFTTRHDVIIIGAGVVGCAVARRFTLEGARVVVVEKAADILAGASKGNTAILHCGFDAPPDSLEHRCIADGYDEYLRIRARLNLPVLKTGALVLAWSGDEADRLDEVRERARANGIDTANLLTAQQARAKEPQLSPRVIAGLHIPAEAIIDPWTTPYAYLLQAVENGARLLRNCEVLGGEFAGGEWALTTTRTTRSRRPLCATSVINCAGLYGDRVDARLTGQAAFRIRPRKGQFLVYDKSASRLLNAILFPLPGAGGKGVAVCRTVFGNVLVGPSSEPQDSRNDTSVSAAVLRALREKGEAVLPALAQHPITATYAGIRPATARGDYCIRAHAGKNYISVGGIRSTGLSAALGIARYVFAEHAKHTQPGPGPELQPGHRRRRWPAVHSIAEHRTRDWQRPGNGGVVCHCELVTRREIRQALGGGIPAASLGGLKRRTRAAMGRCQGFYCHARLGELTGGCFAEEIAVREKHG